MKTAIDLVIELSEGAPLRLRFQNRTNAELALASVADQMRSSPARVAIRNESGGELTVLGSLIGNCYVTSDQPAQYPELSERAHEILGKPSHVRGPSAMQEVREQTVLAWPCGCTARQSGRSTFHFAYLCAGHLDLFT